MSDDNSDKWPRFRLVTFSTPIGVPHGWDSELLENGALDGLGCTALHELTLLDGPNAGQMVCFGTYHPALRLCLNPHSGHVVYVLCSSGGVGNQRPRVISAAMLVNSSLSQSINSVRAVTARLPFDRESIEPEDNEGENSNEWAHYETLEEDWNNAADDLTVALGKIDPAAVEDPDSHWMTLMDDIRIGDYSTQNLLRAPNRTVIDGALANR